ncbi:MAG: hypothetical protein EP330_05345 [Deltaproteobacteria bacterium]|nr:MAG: hypothetical protein EP330_05345 [Deltaproteobacteria bacterium]
MRQLLWLLPLVGACAYPRVITDITASGDQAKFIYNRTNSTENGIIQCDVAEDGSLENCQTIPVVFMKKGE